jgi:hypothetical protein
VLLERIILHNEALTDVTGFWRIVCIADAQIGFGLSEADQRAAEDVR